MTDQEIEKLILSRIKKRGISWLDMVGGKSISYELNHERIVRNNVFISNCWSDRLVELIDDEDHNIGISLQELMRFWWNNCACQKDIIDDVLEDIFVHFKDIMSPKKEEELEPDYELDFSEIITPLKS